MGFKRVLSALTAVLLVLSLCACGGGEKASKGDLKSGGSKSNASSSAKSKKDKTTSGGEDLEKENASGEGAAQKQTEDKNAGDSALSPSVPAPTNVSGMKITGFKFGESVYTENHILYGGDPSKEIPISFTVYLIETGTRKILIDAGCASMDGFPPTVAFRNTPDMLREYGVYPEHITDLILTHSHSDHTALTGSYPNATVYIHNSSADYVKKLMVGTQKSVTFDDTYKVTDGVDIYWVGGHTADSSVVVAGGYIFCGDESYSQRNIRERILSGSAANNMAAGSNFVNRVADSGLIPLMAHDGEILPGKTGTVTYRER